MKNLKKLTRANLETIKGGLKVCVDPNTGECKYQGLFCGEPQCKI